MSLKSKIIVEQQIYLNVCYLYESTIHFFFVLDEILF